MCEQCKIRHREYAKTKRAKRRMEKAAVAGLPAQPPTALESTSMWQPNAAGLSTTPLYNNNQAWEDNIDPRLYDVPAAPAPTAYTSTSTSELAGALIPKQTATHSQPPQVQVPAPPQQQQQQQPTAPESDPSSSKNQASKSLDASRRFCSIKGCKTVLAVEDVHKMCQPCRDKYKVYGTTKRAKWKQERVLANAEIQSLRHLEEERAANSAVSLLPDEPMDKDQWEAAIITEGLAPLGSPQDPQSSLRAPLVASSDDIAQPRMCSVSHCRKILPGLYKFKRCEQHRQQNRHHSKLKRSREKEVKAMGVPGIGMGSGDEAAFDLELPSSSPELSMAIVPDVSSSFSKAAGPENANWFDGSSPLPEPIFAPLDLPMQVDEQPLDSSSCLESSLLMATDDMDEAQSTCTVLNCHNVLAPADVGSTCSSCRQKRIGLQPIILTGNKGTGPDTEMHQPPFSRSPMNPYCTSSQGPLSANQLPVSPRTNMTNGSEPHPSVPLVVRSPVHYPVASTSSLAQGNNLHAPTSYQQVPSQTHPFEKATTAMPHTPSPSSVGHESSAPPTDSELVPAHESIPEPPPTSAPPGHFMLPQQALMPVGSHVGGVSPSQATFSPPPIQAPEMSSTLRASHQSPQQTIMNSPSSLETTATPSMLTLNLSGQPIPTPDQGTSMALYASPSELTLANPTPSMQSPPGTNVSVTPTPQPPPAPSPLSVSIPSSPKSMTLKAPTTTVKPSKSKSSSSIVQTTTSTPKKKAPIIRNRTTFIPFNPGEKKQQRGGERMRDYPESDNPHQLREHRQSDNFVTVYSPAMPNPAGESSNSGSTMVATAAASSVDPAQPGTQSGGSTNTDTQKQAHLVKHDAQTPTLLLDVEKQASVTVKTEPANQYRYSESQPFVAYDPELLKAQKKAKKAQKKLERASEVEALSTQASSSSMGSAAHPSQDDKNSVQGTPSAATSAPSAAQQMTETTPTSLSEGSLHTEDPPPDTSETATSTPPNLLYPPTTGDYSYPMYTSSIYPQYSTGYYVPYPALMYPPPLPPTLSSTSPSPAPLAMGYPPSHFTNPPPMPAHLPPSGSYYAMAPAPFANMNMNLNVYTGAPPSAATAITTTGVGVPGQYSATVTPQTGQYAAPTVQVSGAATPSGLVGDQQQQQRLPPRTQLTRQEPPEKRARFESSGEVGLPELRNDHVDQAGFTATDADDSKAEVSAFDGASSSSRTDDGDQPEVRLCLNHSCRRPIPPRSKTSNFPTEGSTTVDDSNGQHSSTTVSQKPGALCDKCVEKIKRRQLKMKQRLKLEPKSRKRGFGAMNLSVA